jgi:hypothetical protein
VVNNTADKTRQSRSLPKTLAKTFSSLYPTGLGLSFEGACQLLSFARATVWCPRQRCRRGAYAGRGAHTLAEGHIRLPKGHICLSEGCIRLVEGRIRLPPGRIRLLEGRIRLSEGRIRLSEGCIWLAEGRIRLPEGRKRLRKGHAQLPSGRIRLQYVTSEIDPYTCLNRSE